MADLRCLLPVFYLSNVIVGIIEQAFRDIADDRLVINDSTNPHIGIAASIAKLAHREGIGAELVMDYESVPDYLRTR